MTTTTTPVYFTLTPDDGSSGVLDCAICDEPFDADTRTPKSLPCGHTLCAACVEGVASAASSSDRHELRCPFDRTPTGLRCAADVPPNYALKALIDAQTMARRELNGDTDDGSDTSTSTSESESDASESRVVSCDEPGGGSCGDGASDGSGASAGAGSGGGSPLADADGGTRGDCDASAPRLTDTATTNTSTATMDATATATAASHKTNAKRRARRRRLPCAHCDTRASLSCGTCGEPLCSFHGEAHRRTKATAAHTLDKGTRHALAGAGALRRCTAHPSEEFRFFCRTHSALVCRDCAVATHAAGPDHDLVDVSVAAVAAKADVERMLFRLQEATLEVQAAQARVRMGESRIAAQARAVVASIDARADAVVAAVQARAQALKAAVAEAVGGGDRDAAAAAGGGGDASLARVSPGRDTGRARDLCRTPRRAALLEALRRAHARVAAAQTDASEALRHGNPVGLIEARRTMGALLGVTESSTGEGVSGAVGDGGGGDGAAPANSSSERQAATRSSHRDQPQHQQQKSASQAQALVVPDVTRDMTGETVDLVLLPRLASHGSGGGGGGGGGGGDWAAVARAEVERLLSGVALFDTSATTTTATTTTAAAAASGAGAAAVAVAAAPAAPRHVMTAGAPAPASLDLSPTALCFHCSADASRTTTTTAVHGGATVGIPSAAPASASASASAVDAEASSPAALMRTRHFYINVGRDEPAPVDHRGRGTGGGSNGVLGARFETLVDLREAMPTHALMVVVVPRWYMLQDVQTKLKLRGGGGRAGAGRADGTSGSGADGCFVLSERSLFEGVDGEAVDVVARWQECGGVCPVMLVSSNAAADALALVARRGVRRSRTVVVLHYQLPSEVDTYHRITTAAEEVEATAPASDSPSGSASASTSYASTGAGTSAGAAGLPVICLVTEGDTTPDGTFSRLREPQDEAAAAAEAGALGHGAGSTSYSGVTLSERGGVHSGAGAGSGVAGGPALPVVIMQECPVHIDALVPPAPAAPVSASAGAGTATADAMRVDAMAGAVDTVGRDGAGGGRGGGGRGGGRARWLRADSTRTDAATDGTAERDARRGSGSGSGSGRTAPERQGHAQRRRGAGSSGRRAASWGRLVRSVEAEHVGDSPSGW